MEKRDSILEVESLTMKFGELAACDNISFAVEKKEIFGIAGPNGAGKTTLFNCIAGMYRGTGRIIFDGGDINGFSPYRVCHMGIARTFQVPVIFHTMTLKQNIKVGAHFGRGTKDEEKEISEIMELLDLNEKGNVISERLSLYDKKITMMATALATKPKLLLLDEPMSGLSPAEIERCVKLIRRLNNELNLTIIVIEHLMKVLTRIVNRLMILDNGKIISIGNPYKVCQDKNVINVYLGTAIKYA